jgi:hypothetical protein
LCNRRVPEEPSGHRLRNFDAFWVGLNGGSNREGREER